MFFKRFLPFFMLLLTICGLYFYSVFGNKTIDLFTKGPVALNEYSPKAQEAIDQAQSLFQQGRYDEAVRILRPVLIKYRMNDEQRTRCLDLMLLVEEARLAQPVFQ